VSAAAKPYRDLTEQEEVENIMSEGGPAVVLDFWSETCGPCRTMAPAFEAVAAQFKPDEVLFAKINTTREGHLAAPFNIRSVPTLLFIHNGKIHDAIVGAIPAQRIGERAEWLLKKSQKKGLLGRLFG
jgi:thioredoxin